MCRENIIIYPFCKLVHCWLCRAWFYIGWFCLIIAIVLVASCLMNWEWWLHTTFSIGSFFSLLLYCYIVICVYAVNLTVDSCISLVLIQTRGPTMQKNIVCVLLFSKFLTVFNKNKIK